MPRDAAFWLPAVRAIASRHGLPSPGVNDWLNGSDIVFALGPTAVMKMVAPPFRAENEAECAALSALSGHAGIPCPRLTAKGEIEGWPYLVETRMHGVPLRAAGPLDKPVMFLHADATPDNILLSKLDLDWRLSALVDFGDATIGHPEYDLLVPALFLARGDAARLRALFSGYGYAPADLDAAWRRRLTALSLIHRFNDMTRFFVPPAPADLESLERTLWAP